MGVCVVEQELGGGLCCRTGNGWEFVSVLCFNLCPFYLTLPKAM
jgi:hypothetical protein